MTTLETYEHNYTRIQKKMGVSAITKGLSDWEMGDETYTMKSAGEDSAILLTTQHPDSMDVLGWARTYQNSRIFCLQSGHDNVTYSNPNFREVLQRGIHWCANKS